MTTKITADDLSEAVRRGDKTALHDAVMAVNQADLLVAMLRTCIAELRALDAHTIPTQAENLLAELGY